eukprot:m.284558 g.284558  ORF g.284558 m.284558 type:complete len:68 (-) comp15765_c1_seq1:25-228(-)
MVSGVVRTRVYCVCVLCVCVCVTVTSLVTWLPRRIQVFTDRVQKQPLELLMSNNTFTLLLTAWMEES